MLYLAPSSKEEKKSEVHFCNYEWPMISQMNHSFLESEICQFIEKRITW